MLTQVVIAKSDEFRVQVTLDYDKKNVTLALEGLMEAEQPFNQVADYLLGLRGEIKTVAFDTAGVTRINSTGIRSWVLFLRRAKGFPFQYSFSYLNEIFLDQANAYPGMLGAAKTPIDRFEAPYHCDDCQLRVLKVLRTQDLDPVFRTTLSAPPFGCEKCGKPLRFDEIEKSYFSFITRLNSASTPDKH